MYGAPNSRKARLVNDMKMKHILKHASATLGIAALLLGAASIAPSTSWMGSAAMADDGGGGDGGDGGDGGGVGNGVGVGPGAGAGILGKKRRGRFRANRFFRQFLPRTNRRYQRRRRATTPAQVQRVETRESEDIIGINLSIATRLWLRRENWQVRSHQAYANIGIEVTRIQVADDDNQPAVLQRLRERFPAEHFAVNALYVPAAASCGDEKCYGQKLVDWSSDTASCGQKLRIGIVDTSIDRKAPVLKNSKISTRQFHPKAQPSDTVHGTAIAALLVGRKGDNFGGMLPKAQLFAAEVFRKSEDGSDVTNATSIAAGLDWLAGRRVSHVNLSLSGPKNKLLEAAIAGIAARDIVLVAAAGNNGPVGAASYPAAYTQVIAATAVDADLRPYRLANRGDYIDLAAPGVRIWTPQEGGDGQYHSGTSMAAAFTTAILAQLRIGADGGTLSKDELSSLDLIDDIGPEGHDHTYGYGLIKLRGGC